MTGQELNEIGLKGFTAHMFTKDTVEIIGITLFSDEKAVHLYNADYSKHELSVHLTLAISEWMQNDTNRLIAENKALKQTYAKLSEEVE